MTPGEFREARQRLGLTQAELAAAMGICERSIRYKESGGRGISRRDMKLRQYETEEKMRKAEVAQRRERDLQW